MVLPPFPRVFRLSAMAMFFTQAQQTSTGNSSTSGQCWWATGTECSTRIVIYNNEIRPITVTQVRKEKSTFIAPCCHIAVYNDITDLSKQCPFKLLAGARRVLGCLGHQMAHPVPRAFGMQQKNLTQTFPHPLHTPGHKA